MTRFQPLNLVLIIIFMLPWPIAAAETNAQSVNNELIEVQQKIEVIKSKTGIEEIVKNRILSAYYAAEDNLEELQQLISAISEAQQQLKSLPSEKKHMEHQLAGKQPVDEQNILNLNSYPTDELEQRLIMDKSHQSQLEAQIAALELKLSEMDKRPGQIRNDVIRIRGEISTSTEELNSLGDLAGNKLETEARQIQIDSRIRRLNHRLRLLELQNLKIPGQKDIHKKQLQLLARKNEAFSTLIKAVDDILFERRQQEIDRTRKEMLQLKREAESKHPLIKRVMLDNIRYSQMLHDAKTRLDAYINRKQALDHQHKGLEKDFQSAEQKISLAGLSPALGSLLHKQRRNLPLRNMFTADFERIQNDIARTGLEQFKLEELHNELQDLDKLIAKKMLDHGIDNLEAGEQLLIRTELRMHLIRQKEIVGELGSTFSRLSQAAADNDFALNQLVNLGAKFNQFLDQRLLWVRSAPVIDADYFYQIISSLAWITNPVSWLTAAQDFKNSALSHLLITVLVLLLFVTQLWFRPGINKALQNLLKTSAMPFADHFSFTFSGLGYVVLQVLPMAMLVACAGLLLTQNVTAAPFSLAVGYGMMAAAVPLLIIQFFHRLFHPGGYVQTLFDWKSRNVQLLYKQIGWVRFVIIPAVFVMGMFHIDKYSEHSHILGRLALIVSMLVLACMMHRLAHPKHGLAQDYYLQNPDRLSVRIRYFWYLLFILPPLGIVGFAFAGYYQSALELQDKLITILRLIFFTALLHQVTMRSLMLANQSMALQNAKNQSKASSAISQSQSAALEGVEAINEDEFQLDISKINQQSLTLLHAMVVAVLSVGIWLTLADIFPAFIVLDQVVLWQSTGQLAGQEVVMSITVVNLLLGGLYVILMLVFVKNFPALIDLVFAGRYQMSSGTRYALVQLMRYLIITLTILVVVNELGGRWSQVQWLVAALSVGLGFGLQEIFANLVSGIILLFERPVRVGDVVTIGNIDGRITKIQMRATTITDWDRKELIVPNKAFITEKLVNWTLEDSVTRLVIPVGVSYKSDEAKVKQVLRQVISDHPRVLGDPAPMVLFMGFGDSALNFSIRVFVPELIDRLLVTDELHNMIFKAFRENEIEIPFPQRDLHIRSTVAQGNAL